MVSTKPVDEASVPVGSLDAKNALVKRVITSTVFAKSERLTSFLSCVCDLTLRGRAAEINEQKIGTMLFGRSVDYDSSIDGIVRTQASRLRQRLDLYFSGEGANEPIRITLPRGSYVPVFEPQTRSEVVTVQPTVADISPPPAVDSHVSESANMSAASRLPWVLVALLTLLVLALVILESRREPTRATADSGVTEQPLWDVFFRPGERTVIIPGDSGLVMFQGVTKKRVGLADYLSGGYRTGPSLGNGVSQIDAIDLAQRRYTSILDLNIVETLVHVADMHKSKLSMRYARDVRPNDLKEGNVVLIGAAAANPWVELFEPNMNFMFAAAQAQQYTVLNRKPTRDEPSQWTSKYDDPKHQVYGVVAFLPNLGGKGHVLILEGTSMPGTESAWDFVNDDSQISPFLNRIKRPDGTIPHFQCVLGTSNVSGSSVKSTVLAWRITD